MIVIDGALDVGAIPLLTSNRLDQLVKINSHSATFPQFCPVCGAPASATSLVIVRSPEVVKSNKNYYCRPRKNTHGIRETRKGILVPVCERHAEGGAQKERAKAMVTLLAGIAIVLLVFSGAYIGFGTLDHQIPSIHVFAVFGLASLLTLASLRTLGPSTLERTISVLEMDSRAVAVLRIRNHQYLEELLRLNPHAMRPVLARNRSDSFDY